MRENNQAEFYTLYIRAELDTVLAWEQPCAGANGQTVEVFKATPQIG
jgi:hypothetical protein